jgi:hypothetical protein
MMEVGFFQRLYMSTSGEVRRLWVYSLTLRKTPIDPPPKSSPDGRKHDDITMRPILAYPPKENAKRHRTRGQHLRSFE